MVATRLLEGDQPTPRLQLCGEVLLMTSSGAAVGAKELALLAYMSLERGPHSREKLTALLWGEYPEAKARASFRQALKHLRDELADAIEASGATVNLVPDAVTCDVTEFVARAARALVDRDHATDDGNLDMALAIDVSRFLSTVSIRKSLVFDEWVSATRDRLVRRYLQLLALAVRHALSRCAWDEGGRLAGRWVALAPFDDEAVASLMTAQFLGGNPADALATYSDYAARLGAEGDRFPSQSLIELATRIRRESRALQRANPLRSAGGHQRSSFTGSLIGRTAEWDTLSRSWATVCEGGARVVLIEGELGAGKTRLAGDFLRWVAADGGTVLRATGYDGPSSAPYSVVIEALRSALDVPGLAGADPESLAQVARLLPDLRRRFPGIPEANASGHAVDSWHLFEAVAEVVMAIADERPTAIFVDDLQRCDADSCSLIHFLIRRTSEAPVLWCVAFTAGEVAHDAPPARLFRALRIASGIVAGPLSPFTERDVWRLIRELGRIDSPTAGCRLAARLHAVTAGNPFYVIESLKTLFARELLTIDSLTGSWVVSLADGTEPSAPLIAKTVQDAIAERVDGLPEELQVVLATLAVATRGCGPDVLSHVHGISRLRASILVDTLVERHLVVEESGWYRCAHPILADVVHAGLSNSRRRETHRALALSLEFLLSSSVPNEKESGEIAHHAEQGGDCEMSYRYSLLAADACGQRLAHEEALSWLAHAAKCAQTVDEAQFVRARTAGVVERSGVRVSPAFSMTQHTSARVDVADLDLPPRA